MNRIALPIAVVFGLAIAWMDSRPNWDDSGVTAAALLTASGIITLIFPGRAWLSALGVGVWIPLQAIVNSGGDPKSFSMLFVLLFPLAGAYGGLAVRQLAKAGDAAAR